MRYRRWAPAVLAIPALALAACGSSTSPGTSATAMSGTKSASAMSTKSASMGDDRTLSASARPARASRAHRRVWPQNLKDRHYPWQLQLASSAQGGWWQPSR